jgi:hypothetical protein
MTSDTPRACGIPGATRSTVPPISPEPPTRSGLVALVAHHSAATREATQRGLLPELKVWPRERSPVADTLWTADMTTGPRGEALTHDQRLSEILTRYQPTSIVGRAMLQAEPEIRGAINRTDQRMPGSA